MDSSKFFEKRDIARAKRNEYMRVWKKKNEDKVNSVNKNWKDKNRELVREKEREYARKYRAENPDKFRFANKVYRERHQDIAAERRQAWRDKNKDYLFNRASNDVAYYLWESAKKRAYSKGRKFTIEVSDVHVPEYCPILGLKLSIHRGKKQHNSPSIDRIDNAKGYVKGNIRVISTRANLLKSNGTMEEFRAIVAYMEGKL